MVVAGISGLKAVKPHILAKSHFLQPRGFKLDIDNQPNLIGEKYRKVFNSTQS